MIKIIKFIRNSDGEEITLNEDGKTFSFEFMKGKWPESYHITYTEKNLSNKDFFTPVYSEMMDPYV